MPAKPKASGRFQCSSCGARSRSSLLVDTQFGYFLIPNATDPLVATARRVEELGLDYVGVQDHPYQRRFVETWSLLAMIAASTTTLRVFPDVANLPLRQPAVL